MSEETLTLEAVEESIAATIAPLKEQLKLVEGRERLILDDLQTTREMKARLLSTLRKLDPTMPGPGKKPKGKLNGSARGIIPTEQVMAIIREAVDKVAPAYPDGFTRARVKEQLVADGFALGDAKQKAGMEQLHASGYLTLHKIVTGGNKSYKRTEDLQ